MYVLNFLDLPEDPMMEIFRQLPPQVLAGRVSLVCKRFRELALEPSFYEPYVKIIDGEKYGNYAAVGLNFDDLSPIDMKTAIARALPFFGRLDKEGFEILGDAGVAIVDIPADLSPTTLGVFPGAERSCDVMRAFIGDSFNPKKAYRIMISRHVIKGSRARSPFEQVELAKIHKCRAPKVLEIGALFLISFANSSVSLFEKGTTTICEERIGAEFLRHHLKIGHFSGLDGFDQEFAIVPYETDRGVAFVKELTNLEE